MGGCCARLDQPKLRILVSAQSSTALDSAKKEMATPVRQENSKTLIDQAWEESSRVMQRAYQRDARLVEPELLNRHV